MENRKTILYIITVHWGWIKQRPHFLAEHLSSCFDVTVYDVKYLRIKPLFVKNKNSVKNETFVNNHFRIINYILLDFASRPFLRSIAKIVNFLLIKFIYSKELKKYDYIWVGSPKIFDRFKNNIPKSSKLIYDCMDDYLEFPETKSDKMLYNKVFEAEKLLFQKADLVIFSADFLREKLIKRYGCNSKMIVVNNAIEMPDDQTEGKDCEISKKISEISKPLIYIGTIAEWFDFDIIINILNNRPDINLVLVGPSKVPIPIHSQIHFIGPIEHNCIFSVMNAAFALIMPFEVNELIKSVNPVKLYEYIYSGKPVISVRYHETEKFEKYVQLYSNQEELSAILSDIPKLNISREKCIAFVRENTWRKRCEDIVVAIKEID